MSPIDAAVEVAGDRLHWVAVIRRQPTNGRYGSEAVGRLEPISDQDTVNGLRVLAAPILDSDGHPFAAVSVAAPSIASTLEEFVSNAVAPVMRTAAELGRLFSVSGASGAAS